MDRPFARWLGATGGALVAGLLVALAATWLSTRAAAGPGLAVSRLATWLWTPSHASWCAGVLALAALIALPFHLLRLSLLLAVGAAWSALQLEPELTSNGASWASLLLSAHLGLALLLPSRARSSPASLAPVAWTLAFATATTSTALGPRLAAWCNRPWTLPALGGLDRAAPTEALRFELLWQLDFVPWALWLLVLGLWSAQLREVTQRPAVWLSCALLWCGVPTAATLPDLAPPLLAVVGSIALLESLHRLAFQDELTGAASRRALDDALRAVPSQYALALVDVDHFKKINDRHGHAAGDQVLRAVAARLRETRGAELFRYGGEEFALLFRRRSLDEALQAVDAARQRIARHAFVVRAPQRPVGGKRHRNRHGSGGAERTIRVRVSAGVAQGAAASAESTIGAADKALYRAKRAGRNRVLRAPVPRKS